MYKQLSIAITLYAVAGGFSAAQAQVMCGDVITTSEVLTSNLNCSGFDPALNIQGPRGSLNMRGFTLSCEGSGSDGIAMTGSGAVLQNGTVSNCGNGVTLDGSGHRVMNRMILQNNDGDGLLLKTGSGHRITNTTARNNGADGFCVNGDSENFFGRNRGTNNADQGLDTASDFELLQDTYIGNVMTGNGTEGFHVSDGDLLRQNVARANGTDGFLINGSNNKLTRNSAQKNFDDGIDVDGLDNVLRENKASGNGSADIEGNGGFDLEDDNANCDNNNWTNNRGTRNQTCIR